MNVETEKITVVMGKKSQQKPTKPDPNHRYYIEDRKKLDMKFRRERVYRTAFRCAYLNPTGSMRDMSREICVEYVRKSSA